jgi:hypothetical protein
MPAVGEAVREEMARWSWNRLRAKARVEGAVEELQELAEEGAATAVLP